MPYGFSFFFAGVGWDGAGEWDDKPLLLGSKTAHVTAKCILAIFAGGQT